MNVVENWAGRNSSIALSEVIYYTWGDEEHMANMLHEDAVAVGAGVSEGNGDSVYYVLNIAVNYGSGGSGVGVSSTVPTTAATAQIALVQVATPQPDGRIVHVVDTGQALWNIAAAYEVAVDQLKDLNNLKWRYHHLWTGVIGAGRLYGYPNRTSHSHTPARHAYTSSGADRPIHFDR